MPIPTSSMVPNQIPRSQLARQLWRDFRFYAMKARQGMISDRNIALQETPKGRTQQEREHQRSEITKFHERQHYLEMREAWAGVLQSNGLQHEDWGAVSAQEAQSIRQVLGPEELEAEEDNDEVESNNPPPESAPAGVTAQPLSRGVSYQSQQSQQTDSSYSSFSSDQNFYAAPSLLSRSQNTSSASYAFVDPRQFTNDDRDDYLHSFSGSKGHGNTAGSEDEDGGVPVPSYKSWANPGRQQPSGPPTNWNSSNQSSLSSSPADASLSRSHHQLSSSLSSSSHFPPRVPSSLSKSVSANDDADRIFNAPPAKATNSAAAAITDGSTGTKSKSKVRSRYIGPQLTTNDSENEADEDFANMSQADQNAAYERFKLGAREQKIREFHEEAAGYDVELARKMHEHGNGQNRADKALVAQLVTQHEQDMLQLRATKEEERRQLVRDERNRMTAEIEKGRAGVPASTTATSKRGWATTIKGALKNGVTSSTATSSSSAFNNTSNIPLATNRLNLPAKSSSPAFGPGPLNMNLDGLQNVLDHTRDVDLDTAFHISQLLHSEGADDQDLRTPQFHNMNHRTPTAASTTAASVAARQRKDSVSVLEESRFGTISAGGANRRRGTITVSTANEPTTANANGFWRPQAEPSSPEEREALTDQYAKFLLRDTATAQTSAGRVSAHQAEGEDDWFDWDTKPAPVPPTHAAKSSGGGKSTNASGSAWTSKKSAQTTGKSSPAPMMTSTGPGTGMKKSFGYGGGNTGEWGWNQGRGQEGGSHEEYEEVEEEKEEEEEEEEEEDVRPSFSTAQNKKSSSILSDMMTRGKSVVAGAVGAAIGIGSSTPSMPHVHPSGQSRKFGPQHAVAPTPSSPAPTANVTGIGKNATKKGRVGANKKTPLTSFDDFEEFETPPQPTTPRAPVSSTKFTSAFGFGSPPPARNAPVAGAGGVWEDTVSATPKPAGLSGFFPGNAHDSGAGGVPNGVRKPSGLHRQVWNAEEEEEEEEQEEEEEEDGADAVEEEWSMPGSLDPQGDFGGNQNAGRFGMGKSVGAAAAKKSAANNSNAWGWGPKPTPPANAAPPTPKPKKASARAGKRHATMVEEIPDESDGPWNRSPSNVLAPDSRVIMEPKPRKPSEMYEEIIQFGADPDSPENIRNDPPAKNKRGVGGMRVNQGGDEVYSQEWYQKAAMQLQQGTEQGNRIFGEPGGGNKPAPPTNVAVNIPGRGNNNTANGLKSNSAWGGTPTPPFPSSNTAGSMSGSFKDPSPLANGPPPKMASLFGSNTSAPKSSLNQAWGPGISSSPKVGVGLGKNVNAKAKPTTGTTTGFGWGAASSVFGGSAGAAASFDQEDSSWGHGAGYDQDEWGEQNDEEERERQQELLKSKQKLQHLFGESSSLDTKLGGSGPMAGVGGTTSKARKLKEQRDREERERVEMARLEQEARQREEQENQEREAQEKAVREKEAKEKEAAATKAAPPKPGGAKKGKGKKR